MNNSLLLKFLKNHLVQFQVTLTIAIVRIIEMTGLRDSLHYVVYIFMNAALYFCPNEQVLKRLSSLVGYNWRIFSYAFSKPVCKSCRIRLLK